MKKINYLSICALATFSLMSCSEDSLFQGSLVHNGKELRLQAEIDQVNITRANDSGFADGDRIGVFAVDFADGQPGKLLATGNNADNECLQFNEKEYSWSGNSIHFKDDKTPMDVYGYYPYTKEITDVESHPFAVESNQAADTSGSGLSGYEASDLLWAKAAGVAPTSPLATLTFKHILSSVQVSLVEGEGFASDEWATLDKSVLVSGTRRNAVVNLSTGVVTPAGDLDAKSIVACPTHGDFRAVVIPQTVDAGSVLLTITVDGHTYKFIKDESKTYLPSKMHKFTIEVNKKEATGEFEFKLLDEAITAWESDLISHNGEAKEYIVVNMQEGERLESAVKRMGLDVSNIVNLKITGVLDRSDFKYIRENMCRLEALNIKEVQLEVQFYEVFLPESTKKTLNLPEKAFLHMGMLRHCVLPDKLVGIGEYAFAGTALQGSLDIPEGVTYIGHDAFRNYWPWGEGHGDSGTGHIDSKFTLTGTLTLPSTLKVIEEGAFSGCDFSGALLLPEGLVSVGAKAFEHCKFFSGELHLPNTLESIGERAFAEMYGLSGHIVLPKKLRKINGFSNLNVNRLDFPEMPTVIEYRAFYATALSGDFKIPESVVSLGSESFADTKISHIVLPPDITEIPSWIFSGCENLVDTVVIPQKVTYIGEGAFYNCSNLDAVVLPKGLTHIGRSAFCNCYNLSNIRCDAVEPPVLDDNVFYGVEKDNFTLEVPEQSVDAYRNAPGWSEFRRISAYRNFVARPSKYNTLNKGGKKEIILNADGDWEMISCPSWCHVDKTSGSRKTTLTLTVDEMAKGQPNRSGKIEFKLIDAEEHLTHINVGQYDYKYNEDEYLTLQSASKGKGINLVFIGDGYDAADIAAGTYLRDMQQEMEYFFGVEPYTTYREYFNVYTAFALSDDSGVESVNVWRRTKFHVSTGDGCSANGQRLTADWMGALNYCAENIPPTLAGDNPQVGCVLVANTGIDEGLTYMGDSFCAVVTKSTGSYPNDARGLVQHEAGGHGIGWLGDEYVYEYNNIRHCDCSNRHVAELNADHAGGYSLNLSLTGNHKDVPWSHLIFKPGYGDIVDVYEGGYFHSRGVYRSEANSCMNNNVPYYSSWSRQLIVQRIMKLAGERFDLESFYAKDSREMGRDFTGTTRSGAANVNTAARRGNPPVRITNYKYGKKGGKR